MVQYVFNTDSRCCTLADSGRRPDHLFCGGLLRSSPEGDITWNLDRARSCKLFVFNTCSNVWAMVTAFLGPAFFHTLMELFSLMRHPCQHKKQCKNKKDI